MKLKEAIEAVYLNREMKVEVKKKPHVKVEHTHKAITKNDQNDYTTRRDKNER